MAHPIQRDRPSFCLPAIPEGPAADRVLDWFASSFRNPNTRDAYGRAVRRFLSWCEENGWELASIRPATVACWVELLSHELSRTTVNQHLSAVRSMFDYLTTHGVLTHNPSASVKGHRYQPEVGLTPIMTKEEVKRVIQTINTGELLGLRDRAIIGVMLYTFARVSAVCKLNAGDYIPHGKRWRFRFHEKRGKIKEVPAHPKLELWMDEYLVGAGIDREQERDQPLFRTYNSRFQCFNATRVTRKDIYNLVVKRAKNAGLPRGICPHSFRATGITLYRANGGDIETARRIAGHSDVKTTRLYDRTIDDVAADELGRIDV